MKKYYLTGVPGIGKTTVTNELQKLGYRAFDVDFIPDLCHWVNRTTKEPVDFLPNGGQAWQEKNTWECSKERLADLLAKQSDDVVFVSGIANNQDEYFDLFDAILLLTTDEPTFMHRMADRDPQHFGYHEADRQSVLSWYKDFEARTLKGGAIRIDASEPVEKVVAEIVKATTDSAANYQLAK